MYSLRMTLGPVAFKRINSFVCIQLAKPIEQFFSSKGYCVIVNLQEVVTIIGGVQ